MKNFKEEDIPEIDCLIEKATKLVNQIESIPSYSFWDIYKKSKKGEYRKDVSKLVSLLNYKLKKENDEICGLYIFYDKDKPIYVGISNTIIRRIKQHMCGKTHYESTLAYLIAIGKDKPKENEERKKIFRERIETIQRIQKEMRDEWKIKIIQEKEPYARYFLEVYLAVKMQTYWNCFETH